MTALIDITRRDAEQLIGARCYSDDTEPELFFTVGHGEATRAQVEEAKKVCAECPVRVACLEQAITRGEKFGVWGGRRFDVPPHERCGTRSGHSRHMKRKEAACDPCLEAKAAYERDRRKAVTA